MSFEKLTKDEDFSILIRDNTRREFGAYKDLSRLNSRWIHPEMTESFS